MNLDTQLTLNRKLRDEIDHLRHERSLYGDLYKRLSAELQHSKEELTATIGTSTEAFEKRCPLHAGNIGYISFFFTRVTLNPADPNYIPTNAQVLGKMEVNCLIRVVFVRSGIKTSVYVWDST